MSCILSRSDKGGRESQTEEVKNQEIDITNGVNIETTKIQKNVSKQRWIKNRKDTVNSKEKNDTTVTTFPQQTYKQRKTKRRHEKRRNKRQSMRRTKKTTKDTSHEFNIPQLAQQYEDEETTWGDELLLANKEEVHHKPFTRLIHYNVNGISPEDKFLEWETVLQSFEDTQTDIFCLNETKLDSRNNQVQLQIRQTAKKYDQRMYIRLDSSLQRPLKRDSYYKPGGTLIGTKGSIAGRIIKIKNDTTSDTMGRWSVLHMKGAGKTIVSLLTVYRVCSGNGGSNTSFIQQQNDLFERHKRLIDPRKQLLKDLQPKILKLIRNDHKVILTSDINDEAGAEFNHGWNIMMNELGLRNIIQTNHQKRTLPRTYDRGSRCLDIIAVSENIKPQDILRCGIMPFYTLSASDHRALYIDLNTDTIFGIVSPDLTNHTHRRFTTRNVYKCRKYIESLTQLVQEARLIDKVKEIEKDILHFLKELKDSGKDIGSETEQQQQIKEAIEIRLQILDKKRYQLMIAAERKCGIVPMKGMFWYSRKLRDTAKALSNVKRNIRWLYKTGAGSKAIIIAEQERKDANQNLRDAQKDSRRYRDEMLDDLATKCAKKWKMAKETAVKIIQEAEKHSMMFQKINLTVKDVERMGVRSLLIPTEENNEQVIDHDNDDTNGKWEEVQEIESIYERILEQNAMMLCKSEGGMTATGPLSKDIELDASNEPIINEILNGTINSKRYAQSYPRYKEEAEEMIKQMQWETRCKPMSWKFGCEEYRALFNKTKENTSCGPSGLHMSHWKAATDSEELTYLHATLTWAAFALGMTYNRWNTSFHSMLQKMKRPYVHKLRIIQIFEGDMNGGFKYLFGRLLMKKLVKDGIIDSNAFGSIPGRDSLEALKVMQYLYENHRIMKKDMVVIFNDAAGCYDRIRPNQAELCSRRVKCSTSLVKTHTRLQMKMIHKIKTAAGISPGRIQHSTNEATGIQLVHDHNESVRSGNIGGVGQGGGASPVEWLILLLVLMRAYEKFASGASLTDPDGKYSGVIPIISFVDDNSLTSSVPKEMSIIEVFQKAAKEMEHWRKLLQTTGGDLAMHKCTVTLIKWKWNTKDGTARLSTIDETPGTIMINEPSSTGKKKIMLKRLEINQSARQLGVIIPVDGTFQQEYEVRLNQSKSLGRQLYRAPLTHYESLLVYKLYYIPKIGYPLSITTFTQTQCNTIQSQFYRYGLPKIGLNRKTPLALIGGPMRLAGFEFYDIYCDQITQHLTKITQHVRRKDSVGRALISNINAFTILLGSATPFLGLSRARYMYAGNTNTTINYLWQMSDIWMLNLQYTGPHCIKQRYINESQTIMDDAVWDPFSEWDNDKLRAINACRLYHGVTYPSDILLYNKKYINSEYLYGKSCMRTSEQHKNWPTQNIPTDAQWAIWRDFLFKKYTVKRSTTWTPNRTPQSCCPPTSTNVGELLETLYQTVAKHQDVEDYILALPVKLQQYIQFFWDDDDKMYEYWKQLSTNTIHIATDGSHQPQSSQGSGSVVITSFDEENDQCISAGAKCNAIEGMSSLTTEQVGIISALLVLHIMFLRFGIPTQKCQLHVWIDNEEALKRISTTEHDDLRLKSYGVSDYADMKLMRELHAILPSTVKLSYMKIKSHQQPTNPYLISEVELNIMADEVANLINFQMHGPINKYEGTEYDGFILRNNNDISISDISAFIRYQVKSDTTIEYLMTKHKWTRKIIELIDWNGIEKYLKSLPMYRRIKLVQLIHDWQHTGQQKELFERSKCTHTPNDIDKRAAKLHEDHIVTMAKCPFQCNHRETHLHYMECTSPIAISKRRELTKRFRATLEGFQVFEGITSLLLWGINWYPHKGSPTYIGLGGSLDTIIHAAIEEQEKIGWHKLRRGFISAKWSQAQCSFAKDNATYNQHKWSKILIKQILHISWTMWTFRNETLHGLNKKAINMQHLGNLREQVDLAYTRATELKLYNKNEIAVVFKLPPKKRKKFGIEATESWLKMASNVLDKAQQRASTKLEKWLNRISVYIGKNDEDSDE